MKELIKTIEDLDRLNIPYKTGRGWDWKRISRLLNLSEEFIAENANKVHWVEISVYQKLTEPFMEQHAKKLNWDYISVYQKLSEKFIHENAKKLNWNCISVYQKLTEKFIEQHAKKINWNYISKYQKLSEEFIEQHADLVDWKYIGNHQKLSEKFIAEHNLEVYSDNWLYKDTEYKKQAVIDTGLYECHDDYFIAYKGIRDDRYSKYNFQYKYEVGETYDCHADHTEDSSSFGLSAWTEEQAREYCNELVIQVKVYYADVARVVHEYNKIRTSKLTVIT